MSSQQNIQTAMIAAVLVVGAMAFGTGVMWERTRSASAFSVATTTVDKSVEVVGAGGVTKTGKQCTAPTIPGVDSCVNPRTWTTAESTDYLTCLEDGTGVSTCSCLVDKKADPDALTQCKEDE